MKCKELYARMSKAGRILCGRRDEDGHFPCDGVVAATVHEPGPVGSPLQRLVPPEGWRLDQRKGIWHQTTEMQDRQAYGRMQRSSAPDQKGYPFLPALVRCPKCRHVQWLDPAYLQGDRRHRAGDGTDASSSAG